MYLQQGVKIYTKLPISGRIFLSNGVERATVVNGVPCTHKAYVAKRDWRVPTAQELNILFDRHIGLNTKISIIKLPLYVRYLLKKSKIQGANNKRILDSITQSSEFKRAYQALIKYVTSFQSTNDMPLNPSIGHGPVGLEHSSYNFTLEKYPGLHVDSWDEKLLHERHLSRNRILINLGRDARHFLMVNIEMRNLINFISRERYIDSNNHRDIHSNIELFFDENPNYPVVKIKLDPFEGYIAPTDNIIHDGNTEGQTVMDIFFTARSFYNCTAKPSLKIF